MNEMTGYVRSGVKLGCVKKKQTEKRIFWKFRACKGKISRKLKNRKNEYSGSFVWRRNGKYKIKMRWWNWIVGRLDVMSHYYKSAADTIYSEMMLVVVNQEWKKKDNVCMLYALYSVMTEKQKYFVTVSVNCDILWMQKLWGWRKWWLFLDEWDKKIFWCS